MTKSRLEALQKSILEYVNEDPDVGGFLALVFLKDWEEISVFMTPTTQEEKLIRRALVILQRCLLDLKTNPNDRDSATPKLTN